EVAMWEAREPMIRLRKWLEQRDLWDQVKQEELEATCVKTVAEIVERAESIEPPTTEDMFKWLFAETPRDLAQQQQTMRTSSLGRNPEHPAPEARKIPMANLTMVQAINQALAQEMTRDDRILLMGEDVGANGGVFRVTEGLHEQFGSDRVVDTPLAESGIIGTAIGLAMAGLRPVPEIQFEGFLGPAYDQICTHAARMRTRTRAGLTVPLTIRVPVGGGIHAPELHSDSPEAIYSHHPGIKVVMPSSPYDAKGLLTSALRDPDPVIFFEPKRIYRAFREEVPEDEYTVPIGESRIVREGEEMTMVSWGATVVQCMNAIAESGRDIELIDLRTINPMDFAPIAKSVEKTGRAVICHEAPRNCGVGAELAARIMEDCFLYLEAPVQRVAGFDTIMPYYKLELEYLPDAQRIGQAIAETAAY
ncbi:MAG TPA: transketolase C-terminal domain-containing protein, partial [Phycisphaerales bacterium]|nr:transketolase C-terminal domain-containing protein [Phycisphaerales bacterium]